MAAPSTLQRLQKLIWVLIYGGLLTLVLGIATARTSAPFKRASRQRGKVPRVRLAGLAATCRVRRCA